MTNKPSGDQPDPELERILRNLVNTPHMPHVKKPETEPAEKTDKGGDQR